MSYYITCPDCGVHLDPGESCDCKKTAADAANTDGGKVKQRIDKATVSVSMITNS